MPFDSVTQLSLSELFDQLPDNVIWYRAVRDSASQNQITNFIIAYANPKAHQTVAQNDLSLAGAFVRHGNPDEKTIAEQRFKQLCQVLESGQPLAYEYFNTGFNQWFSLKFSKAGDGVLCIAHPISIPTKVMQENERQKRLFEKTLDASFSGIIAYEAVREPAIGDTALPGKLIDFRAVSLNQAAARALGLADQRPGWTMQSRFPGVAERGFFDRYVQVVETGQPLRFETQYQENGIQGWYDAAAYKLDDGLVITFSNITKQKEDFLLKEQQRMLLDSILNTSLSTVFVYEAVRDAVGAIQDFRVRLVNRQGRTEVLARLGIDVVGKTLLEINPESRQSGQFLLFCQVIASGQSIQKEQFYPGVKAWYNTVITKLEDGVIVVGNDITEQKEAALETERQRTLLDAVLNASQDAILVLAAIRDGQGTIIDFRLTHANSMVTKFLGHSMDVLLNSTLQKVYSDTRYADLFYQYQAVTQTGEPYHAEFCDSTNGVNRWYDIMAVKLNDGVVITLANVTKSQLAEQVIKKSAAELQTVIDTAQAGIFLFKPVIDSIGTVVDFRFRIANQWLASYVGLNSRAVIGQLGSQIFPGYKTNGLFEAYRKTYITGESQRFDFHYKDDGVDAWLDIKSTKFGDEVLVTFTDFTPLKHLQVQLENSITDLQRSNKNLEQFAYIASHDLQEPLRKIQAFGDILESQYALELGEVGADMIHRMQSAARRMQVLIKDVLAYSRITTKRDTLSAVPLDQIVAEVLSDLETTLADKGASVTVGHLPVVQGDASQLRQLFQNLISNALKFTRPNPDAPLPAIAITSRQVRGGDRHEIVLAASDTNRKFYLITVTDNGIGFDPGQAERIFQVFQRLHTRHEYQGTGIGLAIVQKVVENHQGYIRAEGRPGQGASFHILLPA